jgi:hypothetical protein
MHVYVYVLYVPYNFSKVICMFVHVDRHLEFGMITLNMLGVPDGSRINDDVRN